MHQTEIRRSWTSLCRGVLIPLILGQKKASCSHLFSVSGILHWWEGKRRKWWWRGVGGLSEVSSATPPPLWSPSMSLPKHSSLALKLADSASSLSVLKREKTTLFNGSTPFISWILVCVCWGGISISLVLNFWCYKNRVKHHDLLGPQSCDSTAQSLLCRHWLQMMLPAQDYSARNLDILTLISYTARKWRHIPYY